MAKNGLSIPYKSNVVMVSEEETALWELGIPPEPSNSLMIFIFLFFIVSIINFNTWDSIKEVKITIKNIYLFMISLYS